MKIKLIFIIFCFSMSYAQDRVNSKIPEISKNTLGIITKSTGWLKNQYGEWVSKPNKIPIDLAQEYKILENFENYALGNDNFLSFELREMKFNDTTYNILIKKFNSGYYRYPSIKEDWIKNRSYDFYVFDKSAFKNLENIKENEIVLLEIPIYSKNLIDEVLTDRTDILTISKTVFKSINENNTSFKNYIYNSPLYFTIQVNKSKNYVRYFISDTSINSNFSDNYYYETDLSTFKKFININIE